MTWLVWEEQSLTTKNQDRISLQLKKKNHGQRNRENQLADLY